MANPETTKPPEPVIVLQADFYYPPKDKSFKVATGWLDLHNWPDGEEIRALVSYNKDTGEMVIHIERPDYQKSGRKPV